MSEDPLHPTTKDAPVSCAVVTITDDPAAVGNEAGDDAGGLAKELLHQAGHVVEFYRMVEDDPEKVRSILVHLAGRVEVVVTTGGTGIAPRDSTVEVATQLIKKPLPGFGELYRMLAFEEVGPAALLTRATAGVYAAPGEPDSRPTLVFCCPGSPGAVRLSFDRLIVPELRLLVWETLRRFPYTPPPVSSEPVLEDAPEEEEPEPAEAAEGGTDAADEPPVATPAP